MDEQYAQFSLAFIIGRKQMIASRDDFDCKALHYRFLRPLAFIPSSA
jgi:hypothetical protein